MKSLFLAAALSSVLVPMAASAQVQSVPVAVQAIGGTRLDISATGESVRVPDIAIITAGVVTRSATATAALEENAARMARVTAALKRAGIADRDIQTSNINLNPEYRYVENQAPQLVGYSASNNLSVRFRDIRNTGRILDALVAEGANQINGPNLTIDKPEGAYDEARANAIAVGRARAELYARTLGMRVVRLLSVSEGTDGYRIPPPAPMAMMDARGGAVSSKIEPGEQKLQVSVAMSFELR